MGRKDPFARRFSLRSLGISLACLLLTSCQAIQPVGFIPFADGEDAALDAPMNYSIENTGIRITVPQGFVTDFASTPRWIWSMLPPFGTYQKASVVHDYLYWMQDCSKEQADKLLYIAMTEGNVDPVKRWLIYQGVKDFGDGAWAEDAKERRQGKLTKFVPPSADGRIMLPANAIWNDTFRRTLHQTADEQGPPQPQPYCALADKLYAQL